MKKAIIDVGSNSVRLFLEDGITSQKIMQTTMLARQMQGGFLDCESITRTVLAIAEFVKSALELGYPRPSIFATEAVRAAKNQHEFIDGLKKYTDIPLDILSGEEEATIAFLGAAIDYMNEPKDTTLGVIDIGGASVEYAFGKPSHSPSPNPSAPLASKTTNHPQAATAVSPNNSLAPKTTKLNDVMATFNPPESQDPKTTNHPQAATAISPHNSLTSKTTKKNEDMILYRKSLPIGAIALKNQCGDDRAAISMYIDSLIGGFDKTLRPTHLVGVSGTLTSLAAMDLGLKTYDARKVHGHKITKSSLMDLEKIIFSTSDLTKKYKTLSAARAEIIKQGITLILALLNHFDCQEITISEKDNLEGYALYRHS